MKSGNRLVEEVQWVILLPNSKFVKDPHGGETIWLSEAFGWHYKDQVEAFAKSLGGCVKYARRREWRQRGMDSSLRGNYWQTRSERDSFVW